MASTEWIGILSSDCSGRGHGPMAGLCVLVTGYWEFTWILSRGAVNSHGVGQGALKNEEIAGIHTYIHNGIPQTFVSPSLSKDHLFIMSCVCLIATIFPCSSYTLPTLNCQSVGT